MVEVLSAKSFLCQNHYNGFPILLLTLNLHNSTQDMQFHKAQFIYAILYDV